ncbi:MAG: ADOP family duplicated permease [Gemmatimonadales bacterium]
MTLREIMGRLRAWIGRRRLEDQLSSELQAHLDALVRDLEAEGLPPAEALATARRRLGNLTALKEASRDAWGFPALDTVLRDLRYAVRGLARSPGFTVTVVLTLGLGIGANAAMFAVIDRLMFRPFPHLREPSRVHGVYFRTAGPSGVRTYSTIPYTRYLDLSRNAKSFSQLAAVSEWRLAVGTGQHTRVRKVAGVSASFFGFFEAPPAQGRYFGPSEDRIPLGSLVAVLSHDFWRTGYGGRDVRGEQLQIGSLRYTLIGVAPEGFIGVVQGSAPDLFIPITTVPANLDPSNQETYYSLYRWDWMDMMVRRKPGVSREEAGADLTRAWLQSRRAQRAVAPQLLPDSVARPLALVGALKDAGGPAPGLESRVLLWVMGVAAIVLVIACANVANLTLARALRRRREIAVRLALGVSRIRLAAQFVTEGLLLAGLGALAGLAGAQWAGSAIRRLLLPQGSTFDLSTDWRTMGVAAACALGAALVTAIGPAFVAVRSDVGNTLKAGPREGTHRRSRLRSALLVTQAALSVVLLVGSGLFVRSLRNVMAIPLGYDASTVIEVYQDFRGLALDSAARVTVRRRLLLEAERIPGVEAAARVNSRLFGTSTTGLSVPGVDSVERLGRFNVQLTTSGYFAVMRTRILKGRGFTPADGEGSPPVAVVSAAMARALWPGQDPLGRCLRVSWSPQARIPAPCTSVVGVAEDVAAQGVLDERRYMYYLSVDQVQPDWVSTLLVRMAAGDLEADLERVRRAMQAVMPGDGFVVVRPLQEVVDDSRRSWRLGATLFTAFGGLALLVAAVGLYGVIAYGVTQRMHELGVRIALGARAGHIVRLVVQQGLTYAAAGAAIGLLVAAFASRWIEPLLYKESPHDPSTYAAVGGLMLAVGLLAALAPSLRAARADPNRALRAE